MRALSTITNFTETITNSTGLRLSVRILSEVGGEAVVIIHQYFRRGAGVVVDADRVDGVVEKLIHIAALDTEL